MKKESVFRKILNYVCLSKYGYLYEQLKQYKGNKNDESTRTGKPTQYGTIANTNKQ